MGRRVRQQRAQPVATPGGKCRYLSGPDWRCSVGIDSDWGYRSDRPKDGAVYDFTHRT